MGEVYSAEDLRGGGRVALKTIRTQGARSAEMTERFRREVESAKRVTSPHVCRIYDIHYHDPRRHPEYSTREPSHELVFLTMELLEGPTLAQAIRLGGRIPPVEALSIFRDIAAGLGAVHGAGIIHRDLKSSNVILRSPSKPDNPGMAKITDFGLARRLHTSESSESSFTEVKARVGTPEYMAPEIRFQLQSATVESDIYSLGVVMHHMLTGDLPVPGRDASPLVALLPPWRLAPGVPLCWEKAIRKCLNENPVKRFHSVGEVRNAIEGSGFRRVALWATAGLLACGLAVLGIGLRGKPFEGRGHGEGRVAVAVFGFRNLTGDSRFQNLSTAFTTGLAVELGAGEDVRVIPGEDVAHLKLDLRLPEVESYSSETLHRIHANTGADMVLLGSYVAGVGSNGSENVKLYLVAQNTNTGDTAFSIREQGAENNLPGLISRSVDGVRAHLHLSGRSPEQERLARSALPKDSEALRIYSQAVNTMHTFDLPSARKLFEQAIAIEPSYAPAHSELAVVLSNLGHDKDARKQAELALSLAGSLPREQRLLVEGEYYDVHANWPKAIESYQTLFNFFPDNLYYGLLLASVQTGQETLKTVERLRQLPPPLRDDPRIDIREAVGRSELSDYSTERRLAARAAEKARQLGALGQIEEAESWGAAAEDALGNPDRARELYADCKQISESIHDDLSAVAAVRGLASLKYDAGDLAGAAADLPPVLETAQRVGSYVAEARSFDALGQVRLAQGRLAEATHVFERALALWREQNNEINTGVEELNVGISLHRRGLDNDARKHLMESLSVLKGIGPRFRARALTELASMQLDEHNPAAARKLLDEALQSERGLNESATMPKLLMTAGRLARITGAFEEATRNYERALEILNSSHQNGLAAQARLGLAEVEFDRKRYPTAEATVRQALAEFEREGWSIDAAYARAVTALCILGEGDSKRAVETLTPALKVASRLEDPRVRDYIRSAKDRVRG